MTLIKDLIDLPEAVHRGDFVLRLSEGIERPAETLGQYVVTPQLATCFENALSFIRGSLEARSSKASYLHGSFGSGKSHFMAVLNLLLRREPQARSISELAPVIAKHDVWLSGKRFLLVPYHMIGARSMESAILGHYVEHVRRVHPEAPIPGVYLAEGLFRDAANFRETLGDDEFFARLNEGRAASGGWGALAGGWTPDAYEVALTAAPRSEERARLVSALVDRYFTAYQGYAAGGDEAYVPLDHGLAVMSQHAKSLGYDAVVLFLDELILWLASHAADLSFVNREGQKLAKLVEAQAADRPIPLISFVARQRDLRELVGEHLPGAEQLGFADVLKYWEARFHTITLEDRNLPAIAEKRVLKPRSESARLQMDQAFRDTEKIREEVMGVLLTSKADREMFRKIYPFSPALIQVLVAVSSVLQRERTALKVMLQLLVSQRDRLQLGDVVPVGDLFDVIAEGDEAFTDLMRQRFDDAKRLYHQKLLPLLEQQHGIRLEDVGNASVSDPHATAFRIDDRLVKTLLLSALAPEVEALHALTPARLAALNHGTIRSPIPGQEAQIVLSKCRQWAAQVGEVRISEDTKNPSIQLQLTGVDTESILEKARVNDNFANRMRRVRELMFGELGIENQDELFIFHEFLWRGTKRQCEVLFANVRDLPDDSLRSEKDWKVVIDFPFDEAGHTPADDLARIQRYEQTGQASATLVWMPAFFSPQTLKDLGTYTVLDHVLAGERFSDYAAHLTAVDRAQARGLLENQRSQLRQRLISCLEGAYGITTPVPGTVDHTHFSGPAEQFASLDPTLRPQPPVGASLSQALRHLLDQMLSHQFPAHPIFEAEVRLPLLRKVYEEVQRAVQTEDGRVLVDKALRTQLRQVANPLELGTMHETHFVLGHRWKEHFQRRMAEHGVVHPTVAELRGWIDTPRPMGLPREVQNLVVLVFADVTNRSFFRHGGIVEPSLDGLTDDLELREQALPPSDLWDVAIELAAAIFGYIASPLRNATNVGKLETELLRQALELREPARQLATRLQTRLATLGLAGGTADRFKTARAAEGLVEQLVSPQSEGVVPVLARVVVPTSAQALGKSLKSASHVAGILESTNWDVFDAVGKIAGDRAVAAKSILERASDALVRDEIALSLGPALGEAQRDALRLIVESPSAPPPPPPPVGPSVGPAAESRTLVSEGAEESLTPTQAKSVLEKLQTDLRQDKSLRLRLIWELFRPGK